MSIAKRVAVNSLIQIVGKVFSIAVAIGATTQKTNKKTGRRSIRQKWYSVRVLRHIVRRGVPSVRRDVQYEKTRTMCCFSRIPILNSMSLAKKIAVNSIIQIVGKVFSIAVAISATKP